MVHRGACGFFINRFFQYRYMYIYINQMAVDGNCTLNDVWVMEFEEDLGYGEVISYAMYGGKVNRPC